MLLYKVSERLSGCLYYTTAHYCKLELQKSHRLYEMFMLLFIEHEMLILEIEVEDVT